MCEDKDMEFEESAGYKQIKEFKFPRYAELPDMELYLEQLVEVVNKIFKSLYENEGDENFITTAMVSNYVKKGIVERPVNKKYGKEKIAYLIFICIYKQVLPLSELKALIELQKGTCSLEMAYDYFCTEFENILREVFDGGDSYTDSSKSGSREAKIVRSVAFSVAHKVYINKYLEFIKK